MSGLVLSHLDYCNGLFTNLPEASLKKLQRVQNIAAKITLQKRRRDSSTSCLKVLHWLPIRLSVDFKILSLVFKCLHNLAPEYLKNLINAKCQLRLGLRSNDLVYDLEVPFVKHKTFYQQKYTYIFIKREV